LSVILDAQNKAVQELEQIFLSSGWVDSSLVRYDKVKLKATNAPIFYRITTPSQAPAVIIQKSGRITQANLYLVYNSTQAQIKGASNKPYSTKQVFYITLNYNDPNLFSKPENNEFVPYFVDMLNGFADNLWVVDDMGESASGANDGGDYWTYQRRLRVEKLF